jgi:hypothetical protein
MTQTIQTRDTATSDTPHLIGIHIALSLSSLWMLGGPECKMLHRILSGALGSRGLLVGKSESNSDKPVGMTLVAFQGQVFGTAHVTNFGHALSIIADELFAIGLIASAHLAWGDTAEGIWRTERPLPEPMPWQTHVDAFCMWHDAQRNATPESRQAQLEQTICNIARLLAKLAKKQQPPLQ